MPSFSNRIKNAWNAFTSRDPTINRRYGFANGNRPDRPRLSRGNERSIITSVYNRIAVDVSTVTLEHVRLDDSGRYSETIKSSLNDVLCLNANIDQTGRALMIDVVMTMFDEGCVVVIPTDTTANPEMTDAYDILTMRTGRVVQWYPEHVRVRLYNEMKGKMEEITLHKKTVAIVENPFYSIMNEPNSTAQRLIRKLNLLDYVDEQSSSGKLDLIIQLPYVIRTSARKAQAEQRRADIENQLAGSKYGIAYTDGTEHITQLNRAVENNMWTEIKDLTTMLYNQLGMTETIFNGTADEKEMLNYNNRILDPILSAIADEMERKFLSKTARSQGQAIRYYRDPFRLVPVSDVAEIADKFTRNEITSSNEIRQAIGMKPSDDPKADELINSNINQQAMQSTDGAMYPVEQPETSPLDMPISELMEDDEELD